MKILFESQDIVAVHKPAGWLSVPTNSGLKEERPIVGLALKKMFGSVYPIHRLDFEVQGLLLFAKNAKAQSQMQKLWEKGGVQKSYQALTSQQSFLHWPEAVAGSVKEALDFPSRGEWVSTIVQGKKRSFVADYGSVSKTQFEAQLNHDGVLWNLNPVTGRRHQLRLELSRRGFPILGDQLYGSQVKSPGAEIALIAKKLTFQTTSSLDLPQSLEIEWNPSEWLKWIEPKSTH